MRSHVSGMPKLKLDEVATPCLPDVAPPRPQRFRAWRERIRAAKALPLSTVALKLARKLASPVGDVGALHVFTWPTAVSGSTTAAAGFEGAEVRPDDCAAVAHSLGKSPDDFGARMRAGDRCFATFAEGEAIHARWVSSRPTLVPELDLWITPDRGEGYVYDSFTAHAWRGRKATAVARYAMNRMLFRDGITRVWTYVVADNRSSLRALDPFQERAFSVSYLRIGELRPLLLGPVVHPLYRS